VLTTLHTLNVVETISRIVSFFPPHQHHQIRLVLAGALKSIVCQRLLARSDMPGRVPALEIMINSGAIRECLMDQQKVVDIPELLEQGQVQYGMQTFDQSIMSLYKRGLISYEEALAAATNPDDFDLRVRGIQGTADRWAEESESAGKKKPQKKSGGQSLGKDFTKF